MPMFASFFHHLADKKHGLPGIYPFNTISDELLLIDKIFAGIAACISIYVVIILLKTNENSFIAQKLEMLIPIGFCGLLCLMISSSEQLFNIKISPLFFTIMHSLWHMIAFYFYSNILFLYFCPNFLNYILNQLFNFKII
jgi:hypothetical protein